MSAAPDLAPSAAEIRRRLRRPRFLLLMLASYGLGAAVLWNTLGCSSPAEITVYFSGGSGTVTAASDGTKTPECSHDRSTTTCTAPDDVAPLEACIVPSEGFDSYGPDCLCGTPSLLECSGTNACDIHTVEESRTCHLYFCGAGSRRTLSVTLASGQGRVSGTGGISLRSAGEMQSTELCAGDPVSLTRTPAVGWLPRDWSGEAGCADSLTLTANLSCTAEFYQPTLSVDEVTGSGTVTSGSMACREGSLPADCERVVAARTNPSLVAAADPGALFQSWGGDCAASGTNPSHTVSEIARDTHCTASFSTVTVGGGGSGVIEVVSVADDESYGDADSGTSFGQVGHGFVASADLSRVGFRSSATNLGGGAVPAGTSPPFYLRDRAAGSTRFLSETASSTAADNVLSLSADGRFGVFEKGENFGDSQVYLLDLADPLASAEKISIFDDPADVGRESRAGGGTSPVISANGRHVAYLSESNAGEPIVAAYDSCFGAPPQEACVPHRVRISDPTLRYSRPPVPPRVSADGRFVYFFGAEFPNVFGPLRLYRYDRDTDGDGFFDEAGTTATSIESPDPSGGLLDFVDQPFSIDASGRYVAFGSQDPDLPGGFAGAGRAAFSRDTCAGASPCDPGYTRLTVRQDGSPGEDNVFPVPILSASGRFAAFTTTDSWLVGVDPNDPDAFFGTIAVVRDTCIGASSCTPENHEISLRSDGVRPTTGPSYDSPIVSADGGLGAFVGGRVDFFPAAGGFVNDVLLAVTGFVPELGSAPTIGARTPVSAPHGSAPIYLTITAREGPGFFPFVPGAHGNVGPSGGTLTPRHTVFVSPIRLLVLLEEEDLQNAGVLMLEMENPGGSRSTNQVSFVVN